MRLTTKFSAFVTLLTGLTIFVTLLGCSLSFYNAIQYKFSHRVQAVATAIDTHLVSNDFSTLRPQITELMMSADIVRVDLLHGVDLVVAEQAFAGAEHVAFVAFARDGQLGDELLLGHRELTGREGRGAQFVQLLLDEFDALRGIGVLRTEVDGHDPRVAVGGVGGLDVVR